MTATERLRNLDRRAATYGQRFQRQYDAKPPLWLRHAWLLVLLGPLMLPLTMLTSPAVAAAVLAALLAGSCAVAFTWMSKHRL
jgi:hypothetical protein